MTTEEKANAYDEALEQAKKALNTCGSLDCDAARQIFRFFPQLRESDDEKIRKHIIDIIKDNAKLKCIPCDAEIAYLEKHRDIRDILQEKQQNIIANMYEDRIEGIQHELIQFLSNTINASWVDILKSADSYAKRIKNIIEKQKELPFVKDVVLGYPGLYFYDGERMHFRGNPAMEEKQKEPHYTKRNALFDKCVENCDPKVMKEVSDNIERSNVENSIETIIREYRKTQGEWIDGYDMDTLVVHLREAFDALENQKEQSGEDEKDKDFTIYYPLKNEVKGEYECFPYSFYGSLTSFSENKDLIDFLRNCFYTEEECNEWIKQQKEQKQKCSINFDPKLNEFEACMLRYLQSAANRKDDNMIIIDTKGYAAQLMEIAKKEQKPLSTEETELNSIAFLEQMGYTCIPPEKEQKPVKWKPQPESLEALMYAIEGKWDMIPPTSYLSRRLEDLYEGLVNTFNVDESFLTELPKVASRAYTAEGIEELRELKHKIEASMEQKPVECGCTNDESDYDRGYREGKKFQLRQVEQYTIGKTFMGLIPCWVNAPSELQPAHKYHGKNAVIMHENNGGFRCCFIDDEKATTVHLPEDTLFVEGWKKKPVECLKAERDGWYVCTKDYYRGGRKRSSVGDLVQAKGGMYMMSEEDISEWFRRAYYEEVRNAFEPNTDTNISEKPAEWSEEDSKRYLSCLKRLETDNPDQPETVNSKWFKLHVSSHPHWKPSEEQMDRLFSIIAALRKDYCDDMADFLASIYHDLKKLM